MSRLKAQSVAEYSICIGIVIAAILGMQVIVRTILTGQYKEMVDCVTKQAASSPEYRPYYVEDTYRVKQSKITDEDIQGGGEVNRDFPDDTVDITGTSIRNVE